MRLVVLMVVMTALAGCSGGSPPQPAEETESPGVEVTVDTGGIRGVVVDQSIVPVEGATIRLHTGPETKTDSEGRFFFGRLDPGTYVVTAQKLGHITVDLTTPVVAGDAMPEMLKIQLDRIPGREPYVTQHTGTGFYECGLMVNIVVIVFSDSCDFPIKYAYDIYNETGMNPPFGRGIMATENRWRIDVVPDVETYVHELVWADQSVSAMIARTCDASEEDPDEPCGGDILFDISGPSPLLGRMQAEPLHNRTVYHFGGLAFEDGAQYAVNFSFSSYVTLFHNFEAPSDWSLVAGDDPSPP